MNSASLDWPRSHVRGYYITSPFIVVVVVDRIFGVEDFREQLLLSWNDLIPLSRLE